MDGLDNFKQFYSDLFVKNGLFSETINTVLISNINSSTQAIDFESVAEMREYAPSLYKMGNRLVTADDYKTYILTKYSSRIQDVTVTNNYEYTTIFYKWLNDYGKLNIDIRKYNYMFADACDFNNIYLWLLPNNSTQLTLADKMNIVNDCSNKKTMTSEIVPCDAIKILFVPFIKHPNIPLSAEQLSYTWSTPCTIVITKKNNGLITDSQLKTQINNIFVEYFNIKNQKLGNAVNIDELEAKIYKLSGVKNIKTRYNVSPGLKKIGYLNYESDGLSLASFTQPIIESADFDVFNHSKKVYDFQYPALYNNTVADLIEIEYIN